jgi:hypothetical protein
MTLEISAIAFSASFESGLYFLKKENKPVIDQK